MSNIEILSAIPNIKEIRQMTLEEVLPLIDGHERGVELATQNNPHVNAYKIKYLSGDHLVVGYILEPKGSEKLPAVIWNRGGTREFGKIADDWMFRGRIPRLARAGYVIFASQYSGNDGGEGEDQFGGSDVDDVVNLYELIKAYPRSDETRIAMHGESRGGMMVYQALTKVNWIKAVVIGCATVDLLDRNKFRPELVRDTLSKVFDITEENLKKRSALYWVDKLTKNVPILLMHGTSDWRVDPLDTLEMAVQFQKLRIPYKLVMFEGVDHGFTGVARETLDESVKWFNRYVRDCEPLPNLVPYGK